eukprot:jgi/Tetstr1/462731/TSEL_007694.t1
MLLCGFRRVHHRFRLRIKASGGAQTGTTATWSSALPEEGVAPRAEGARRGREGGELTAAGSRAWRAVTMDRGGINWQLVDSELSRVSSELSSTSFDSLPHVIDILSQIEPEVRLEELRSQQQGVESLVDDVVRTYHNGFNKALQNYSGILRHFSSAEEEVATLRRALEDSRKRLGAKSRHLQAQWRKNITFSDTIRLLDDIQSIVELPEQIRALEKDKDWTEAIALLLEGCNKLARDELSKVEGLSTLRKDMVELRQSLQDNILQELQRRIYTEAPKARELDEDDDAAALEDADPLSQMVKRRMSASDLMASIGLTGGGSARPAGRPPQRQGSLPAGRKSEGGGRRAGRRHTADRLAFRSEMDVSRGRPGGGRPLQRHGSIISGDEHTGKWGIATRRLSKDITHEGARVRAPPARRTSLSSMDLGSMRRPSSANVGDQKPSGFETLVQCLVQIGGIRDAKAIIRESMPSQVRTLIRSILKSTKPPALPEPGANTAESAKGGPSVPTLTEAAAREVLQRALDACLAALRNLAHLYQMIGEQQQQDDPALRFLKAEAAKACKDPSSEDASSSKGAAGGAPRPLQRLSLNPIFHTSGDDDKGRPSTVLEMERIWTGLMFECKYLLKEMLGPMGGDSKATESMYANSTAGSSNKGEGAGRLAFHFDVLLEGFDPESLLVRRGHDTEHASETTPSYRSDVEAALGREPSQYFTAALYRPVVQFVDSGNRLVDGVMRETGGSRSQSKREATGLRHFLEELVVDSFLPRVRVDFRARCNAILEDSEMFRPRARFRAAYEKDVGKGRPVLGVSLALERLVVEVMAWASSMPLFAQQLTGVVEGLLGRMLEACAAVYSNSTQGGKSASAKLAARPELAAKMASEPAAALLQDAVKFYVPKREDEFDSRPVVAAITSGGLGCGEEHVEHDLLEHVFKEQPVAAESLLINETTGDMSRLTQLAALSDSLDYMAEVIHTHGSGGSGGHHHHHHHRSGRPASGSERQHRRTHSSIGNGAPLSEALATLRDRCKSLSGRCLRTLRLELSFILLHYLQELPKHSFVAEEQDTIQAEERLGALTRMVSRLEESVLPFLPSRHRLYVLGGAAPAAARILRMQVPAMEQINPAGVDAMCKVCSTLQPVLTALGATADALGAQSQQAGQQFDATRTYYGLLKMPVDSFIKFARERPHRYFASEYFAVLDVLVPGRAVTEEHRAQLEKVLGRKKGRKANVTRDALRPERRVNSGSGALDGATSLTLMERLARERNSEKAAEVAAEHRLERPQRQTAQR